MKNLLIFIFPILTIGQLNAQEKKLQFGISTSAQLSFILLNDEEMAKREFGMDEFSYNLGLKTRYFFKENISLLSGLFYQLSHYNLDGDFKNVAFQDGISLSGQSSTIDFNALARPNERLTLYQVMIPFNFEFWLNDNWNLLIGLNFQKAFIRKRTADFGLSPNIRRDEVSIPIKEIPIALNFGINKKFPFKNTALAIGTIWQMNFHQIEFTPKHQSNFQFLAGLDFTFWFN